MEQQRYSKFGPEGSRIQSLENKALTSSKEGLEKAKRTGKILEGIAVKCDSDHNLIVRLQNGLTGIIPREEGALGIKEGKVRDIALLSRTGKPVCFFVEEVLETALPYQAVFSRAKAQAECKTNWLDPMGNGELLWGTITHIDAFGCFLDVGCGITALLPIDATGVSRIETPTQRFFAGQTIPVLLRCRDEQGRLLLTHRELLGTWEENVALFSPGETVKGIVRSVEDYGIFVELTPNLAGLAEVREGVGVGMSASVYIKSILPERMKIKLALVDCYDDPSQGRSVQTNYYLPKERMKRWQYSPDFCQKMIETVFEWDD